MENEFASYEQSLAVKELGFDEPCFAFYQEEYTIDKPVMVDDDAQYRVSGFRTCRNSEMPAHYTSAPLKQQLFKWFRDKRGLNSYIRHECPDVESYYEVVIDEDVYDNVYDTYEEAEDACIDKLIEIVKQK
jgi:hypothetical protein